MMENVFWALVVGFSVLTLGLYELISEIGRLRNDVQEMKDETIKPLESIQSTLGNIEGELGWRGTLRKQLTDIETAIRESR